MSALYLMAEEIVQMEADGLPGEIAFRRLVIVPNGKVRAGKSPAWTIHQAWANPDAAPMLAWTVHRSGHGIAI